VDKGKAEQKIVIVKEAGLISEHEYLFGAGAKGTGSIAKTIDVQSK